MARFEKHSNTRFLEQRLEQVQKGELVTYAELSEIISMDVQAEGRRYVDSAKRALEKEGYVFEPENGVGYYRLTDQQIIETQATKRLTRVRGQMNRAIRAIKSADTNVLSNDDRIAQCTQLAMCGAVKQFTKPRAMLKLKAYAVENDGRLNVGETLSLMAR